MDFGGQGVGWSPDQITGATPALSPVAESLPVQQPATLQELLQQPQQPFTGGGLKVSSELPTGGLENVIAGSNMATGATGITPGVTASGLGMEGVGAGLTVPGVTGMGTTGAIGAAGLGMGAGALGAEAISGAAAGAGGAGVGGAGAGTVAGPAATAATAAGAGLGATKLSDVLSGNVGVGDLAKNLTLSDLTKALGTAGLTLGSIAGNQAQADAFKNGWRQAHTMIKTYWFDLQAAAIRAVKYPGEVFDAGAAGRVVRFRKRGSFLWCRLPSGRTLCYPYPDLRTGDFGEFLSIKGVPDQLVWATYTGQKERGEPNSTYIVDDPANSREWCRIATYGGKLAENVTQAICRDILAEAIVRVEAAGFPVVLHVHDEVVCEGTFTEKDRLRFQDLMTEIPAWATGFPISAGCWLSPRYIKG